MFQGGFARAFHLRNDPLRESFSEFDAPLVETVDLPDDSLGEHAVLIQRHQLAERRGVRRSSNNVFDGRLPSNIRCGTSQSGVPSGLHLFSCLAERQRLGLREDVGEQDVVMPSERIQGLARRR